MCVFVFVCVCVCVCVCTQHRLFLTVPLPKQVARVLCHPPAAGRGGGWTPAGRGRRPCSAASGTLDRLRLMSDCLLCKLWSRSIAIHARDCQVVSKHWCTSISGSASKSLFNGSFDWNPSEPKRCETAASRSAGTERLRCIGNPAARRDDGCWASSAEPRGISIRSCRTNESNSVWLGACGPSLDRDAVPVPRCRPPARRHLGISPKFTTVICPDRASAQL